MISTGGRIYFLARPRRFGKSLLVSTLDELYSGRKELFKGLYIYDKWDWTKQYPVIRLDFGEITFSSGAKLKISLHDFVDEMAEDYSITLSKKNLSDRFGELIKRLSRSTGQQVVILIDEYDRPIINHLSNPKKLERNRTILHDDFYPVLKASDKWIKFIFITGVSKFSGLSVFSALNNPDDITLNEEYASICGYTQEELETYFSEYIDELAVRKDMSRDQLLYNIKQWYNGYSWDGETSVYNPISTLQLFNNNKFANYWFKTATPMFLMEMLKISNNIEPILKPIEADESMFDSYDPEEIGEIPLLFQTGYLTIKSIETTDIPEIYTLDIPNMEVRESFTKRLLHAYSKYPLKDINKLTHVMYRQVYAGDTSGFNESLCSLMAKVPNILHEGSEGYYHSIFLVAMKMLGFDIQGEVLTNIGRIDVVWNMRDLTIVAELKYSADKTLDKLLDEAMAQIYDRKYYEAYLDRRVMLMAVAFTNKEVKCEMKMLKDKE
jgi:hypothetical protein